MKKRQFKAGDRVRSYYNSTGDFRAEGKVLVVRTDGTLEIKLTRCGSFLGTAALGEVLYVFPGSQPWEEKVRRLYPVAQKKAA